MHRLESALNAYTHRKTQLGSIINGLSNPSLRDLGTTAVKSLAYYENSSRPFENPVDVYHITLLLFHLRIVLQRQTDRSITSFVEMHTPQPNDLVGLIENLLRLQWMYEVRASHLANGHFGPHLTRARPLNLEQTFLMSHFAGELQFYSMENEWLVEILRRQQQDPAIASRDPTLQNVFLGSQGKDLFRKILNHLLQRRQAIPAAFVAATMTQSFGYHEHSFLGRGRAGLYQQCVVVENVGDMDWDNEVGISFVHVVQKEKCREEVLHPSGFCRYRRPTHFHVIAPVEEEVLMQSPLIRLWHRAVTDREINTVIAHSSAHLDRATVIGKRGDYVLDNTRQSQTHFISSEHPVYATLDKRLSQLGALPINRNNSEQYQANNYGLGGFYHIHYDFFRLNPLLVTRIFRYYDYHVSRSGECSFLCAPPF